MRRLARINNLPVSKGAYITSSPDIPAVVEGSPASKIGIKKDDIILKLNEEEITPERSLASIMRTFRPGDKITVTWLSNGEEKTSEVILDSFGE